MVSTKIQQIIDEVKQLKNSLPRNKTVSHLEDAKAHALQLETSNADPTQAPCTCQRGFVDAKCPTHGTPGAV